jgi:hypothetical protein
MNDILKMKNFDIIKHKPGVDKAELDKASKLMVFVWSKM